jgi:SAM-dependent methyltransferase
MDISFLDQQARIGISVHLGGLPATRRLLSLCHLAAADEVLDIGCGIGIGPAHIARTYDCAVVGVDISPQMIDWARRRACGEGVEDRVSFVVADILSLPFEDGRFDVVIAESVLAFVVDKERAIAEMVRVTRPGGHVGLNEGFLLTEAPTPRVAGLARQIGSAMVTLRTWRALWDGSGLNERVVRTYRVDPAREIRDRFRWVGLRRLLGGSARAAWLYLTRPSARPVLDTMFVSLGRGPEDEPGAPPPWASFGYGLFVGRKQVDATWVRCASGPDDMARSADEEAAARRPTLEVMTARWSDPHRLPGPQACRAPEFAPAVTEPHER